MHKLKVIEAIIGIFPVERLCDNFIDDVDRYMSDYIGIVNKIDEDVFATQNDKYEVVEKITFLRNSILEILHLSFKGLAYNSTKLFMETMIGNSGFLNNTKSYTIEQNSLLYRARFNDNDKCFAYSDMFHIPFDKRERVQAYRYSKAGHPCLYLGVCPDVCCLELGKEHKANINISKFKARSSFEVYDLRIPVAADFEKDKIKSTLLRIPLVILCSIKVRDHNDSYKQEYIIPQMLIETIYSQNLKLTQSDCGVDDVLWGIIYSSTKVENHSDYDRGSNVVLPSVIVDWNRKYCYKLASLFDITDSFNFEKGDEDTFHTLPHIYLNVPKSGIKLNSNGDAVVVKVITNGDYYVE